MPLWTRLRKVNLPSSQFVKVFSLFLSVFFSFFPLFVVTVNQWSISSQSPIDHLRQLINYFRKKISFNYLLKTSVIYFKKLFQKSLFSYKCLRYLCFPVELMLLGLISLFLAQCARWISEICVDSSLFSSRFYICSEKDYGVHENRNLETPFSSLNETQIPPTGIFTHSSHSHQCGVVKNIVLKVSKFLMGFIHN